ncbi:type I polyketide synthase [Actinoalloteichus fjordicus]|uniref:6-deoxyerythronolide-B synthase n=1 Tax=Actinoalloteichus fjordicus TaxID=1612552 RepID=A0AAC9PSS6_9PSEU|nr:type I polyketide synthase [Actinoalloteichus fjordicus]APU15335.1 polyketide synthase family protein [Actinoalloteichus fjordicus]
MTRAGSEPIAIVGISCRFPQAPDPSAFWRLLTDGIDAIRDAPVDRYPAGTAAGYLDEVDRFDPAFFGLSPSEAAMMDPQQRLVLELSWEALENAGILPGTLAGGPAGVFVGAMAEDYRALAGLDGSSGRYVLTGLYRSMIANRISYFLRLHGPSLTVDTGQSSSLVAVHLACESLRAGESGLALAGGVQLNLVPDGTAHLAALGVLSPDGRCHTFDHRANGIVRGEGGGFVVLKRLADAVSDGDTVHGVILGSATNNDGGGANLTAPSETAQRDLLRTACRSAGVEPAEVQYVELHGTGTRVGDPIEAAALGAALGAERSPATPLLVGSVKTNIGHLEGASGIAGLLKTVLALRHEELPPSLNFERPNPAISLPELGLRVQTARTGWPGPDHPPVAGVSSFGIGGTNCHVVLAGYAEASVTGEPGAGSGAPGAGLATPTWLLSARSRRALRGQAERLAAFAEEQADLPVEAIGAALRDTRTTFEHRAVVQAATRADLIEATRALALGEPDPRLTAGVTDAEGEVVFVFPGQGAQWADMAVELLDTVPVFAEHVEACSLALARHTGWSVLDVLRGVEGAPDLGRTAVVQPVLFAMSVSLAQTWRAAGIEPAAVIGHSQGEVAAAHVAGALSLDDAAKIAALRVGITTDLLADSGGGMLILGTSAQDYRERFAELAPGVSIAALNGPESIVLAGPQSTLDAFAELVAAQGVRCRGVRAAEFASHSPAVEPAEQALRAAFAGIEPRRCPVRILSTVTGDWVDGADLDADYWYRNLRSTVRFEPGVRALAASGHDFFIEVSPHPILVPAIEDTLAGETRLRVVIGTLRRDEPAVLNLLSGAAQLHVRGLSPDWNGLLPSAGAERVELPTYAFQRRRHWLDGSAPEGDPEQAARSASEWEALIVRRLGGIIGDGAAVDPRATFKDLGCDSMSLVELRAQVGATIGRPIPVSVLFSYPTPAALAGHLAAEQPDDVDLGATEAAGVPDLAEPLAIVSMACRFPGGVVSPEQLWDVVAAGGDVVSDWPQDRGWDLAGSYDPQPGLPGRSYAKEGGFLTGAGGFDADFFGVSPREALAMDPQQRLLLEVSWEAVERAGLAANSLQGSDTGVFVGTTTQEYGARLHEAADDSGGYTLTGTAASVASGRIAYTLGLLGPSMTVDTACSSSLVALHLAARALRQGECSMALVGGATVMATPGVFVEFSRQRGLAPDGRCKAFAESADGTGWSEGVGVLLVERLSDARRNGHPVLAVVRGSAVNSDGASNGLTAPNGVAQQRVIRRALADAGLVASEVDAVEAHGTGTTLGDPIEAQALLATYGRDRPADRPLWLGSLKSNIGHSQAAAGVGGVIKMVQALRHGVLPKTLHVDVPSSHVDWDAGAVRLLTEQVEWPAVDRPRRVGVSSFGISGTNAHVIVEEAPEPAEVVAGPDAEPGVVPWLLSARSPAALSDLAGRLAEQVGADSDLSPVDTAFTLAVARDAMEHRAVVIGAEPAELLAGLGMVPENFDRAGSVGRVVLVFPGQGSQWVGMGRELLGCSPVFAARFAECGEALAPWVDWSLVAALDDEGLLARVDVVQPVLFAVLVSLAAVWESFGVRPDAVVGHSQGEIAAAVVAGGLSLSDGARVVCARSRLIAQTLAGGGGMLSVALPEDEVRSRLTTFDAGADADADAGAGGVSVAAVNGPSSVVVSGEPVALAGFAEGCESEGVRVRWVAVDYASHSEQVERLEADLLAVLAEVTPRSSEVGFFSTVTGDWIETSELDAGYWYRNLRQTVHFHSAITALAEQGYTGFVESSPHPVLTMSIQDTLDGPGFLDEDGLLVTGTLRRDDGGLRRLYDSVGQVWMRGYPVDWASAFGDHSRRVPLPTYPFQHTRYWLETRQAARRDEAVDDWRYRIAWADLASDAHARLSGTWLAVTTGGHEPDLYTELAGRGAVIRTVALGEEGELAESLRAAADEPPVGVLLLLGSDDAGPTLVPAGLDAITRLLRALAEAEISAPLWCVTRGAVSTGDTDRLASPDQATAWGLGLVAALEHPRRWGGLIDLPAQDGDWAGALAAALTRMDGEDQLAIRPDGVYGRRLVRAPLPAHAGQSFRPAGTVLVTGGTGTLGAHIARWLARAGADHLVLVGRRGAATDGVPELVAELEEAGTEVTVAACDITDRAAVADLAARLAAAGHPVRSIVHAAGIGVLEPLSSLGVESMAEVLAAKVGGLRTLDEVFDLAAMDKVLLFSSISSAWGVADHGAYAAANAYLDAFARQRWADGAPIRSIAWGPWGGGGMIPESLQDVLRRRGVPVLDPATAVRGLERAAGEDTPFLAIAEVDWPRFLPVFSSTRTSTLFTAIAEEQENTGPAVPPQGSRIRAELAGRSGAERKRALLELVQKHTAAVLGHTGRESVAGQRAFTELGFDSLTAVELRNRLTGATGLRLPATLVYDYPSPTELAHHLEIGLFDDGGAAVAPVGAATVADPAEPIAIVAMSCRLPGGLSSPEELFEFVAAGGDAIGTFPLDRGWDLAALFNEDPQARGRSYVREGGFLQDVAGFDAGFFGISPREALSMDPQQRLLLETSWEALERGGLDPRSLRGSQTGVFVGLGEQYYGSVLRRDESADESYAVTGEAGSVASGRIAYVLGLEGPALTIDTACSSSLVAMHLAVRALRAGECGLALAGAAMVMSTPAQFSGFSSQRGLAPDGRCKSFAEAADGFALSEGAGMLVLERLSDARRNGHEVLAVVRGSAVNQDGASNGLTAPNGPSQQRVIRQALTNSGLEASEVDVVEAHGTGTTLGDPIEAQALLATYGRDRPAERPLWLGSVKSNIGHTQTVAGLAGVIKIVESMRRGILPKTLHVDAPTSHVDWDSGAVRLLTEQVEWPDTGEPRRAGVSAFGISGTNAHVVLEQAPDQPETAPPPETLPVAPWVLSARSAQALRAQAARLAEHAGSRPELSAMDLGCSLVAARSALEIRAVLAGDRDELLAGLHTIDTGVVSGPAGRVALVFPGQGSQWVGMGRELSECSPVFAARFAECGEALAPWVEWSLVAALDDEGLLARVDVVQPVLFAVLVSLAAVWESFGVRPDAVVGHSQGEIAAAVVAGGLSLSDGARVVCARSRLIAQTLAGGGGMLSVALPEDEVRSRLTTFDAGAGAGVVSVAAVNGPSSVVVSGESEALAGFAALCESDGVRVRWIAVDYASHSEQVERLEADLLAVLAEVTPRSSEVGFFSTVTGDWIDTAELDAAYWYRNLRQTVHFHSAITSLAEQGYTGFVESSPHPVLTMSIQDTLDALEVDGALVTGTLRRDDGGLRRLYDSVGQAWALGYPVDWTPAFGDHSRPVPLPTYPFQHTHYWPDVPVPDGAVDSWRYRLEWTSIDPPENPDSGGTWLLVAPDACRSLAEACARGMESSGQKVVSVEVDHDDRSRLAERLRAATDDHDLRGVLSLLATDGRPEPDAPALRRGLTGTFRLVQALLDIGVEAPLWTVTTAATAAAGEPVDHPDQAAAWGFGIVAGLDLPDHWGGLIDLPAAPGEQDIELLCAALSGAGDEDQLAVRSGGLHGRRLVRANQPELPGTPWTPRGTALITGGTGALGAHAARWLAANGAEHLVLTSRSGSAAPGASELTAELTALGAEVTIAACDVADRDAVADLLRSLPEPPAAIVHAAGIVAPETPLTDLELTDFTAMFGAKVAGARHLDELTSGLDLDAFVLFSSGAGVWGNARQPGYAAANAYLDALAHRRQALGLPATAISWGAWAGGGMVDAQEAVRLRQRGVPAMAPELAVTAMEQAVRSGVPHVVVADIDWTRFAPTYTLVRARPLLGDLPEVRALTEAEPAVAVAAEDDRTDFARTLAGLSPAEQRRSLIDLVNSQAARVLGHSGTLAGTGRQTFRELGFDSVTAVDFRNRLGTVVGLRLPATLVFDFPTPAALAEQLLGTLVVPDHRPDDRDPLAELERFELGLTRTPPTGAERAELATRLEALLRRWGAPAVADHSGEEPEDLLDTATDDEMFELIDNELGLA